jgi:HEPN domain-containing protein
MSAVEQWIEQSRYDLDTARSLLSSGRYLYVLFCCQQAAEKALKALIAKRSGEHPPRIHQLTRLAETAGLDLAAERAEFFRELSSYYIQSRYPEEIASFAAGISEAQARGVFDRTEETVRWLLSIR